MILNDVFKLIIMASISILAIFCLYLTLRAIFKSITCTVKAEAVVVNIIREYRNNRLVYVPEIGYLVNDIEYYTKLSPSNKYGIKQHFPIWVNKKNPSIFTLTKNIIPNIILSIILILMVIGLYYLFYIKNLGVIN